MPRQCVGRRGLWTGAQSWALLHVRLQPQKIGLGLKLNGTFPEIRPGASVASLICDTMQ